MTKVSETIDCTCEECDQVLYIGKTDQDERLFTCLSFDSEDHGHVFLAIHQACTHYDIKGKKPYFYKKEVEQ